MNYGEFNNGYSKLPRHILHPFMPDGVFDNVTFIFITRRHYYILPRGQFVMPKSWLRVHQVRPRGLWIIMLWTWSVAQ